ncbi:MAG TPA: glycosyltransferase family 2 protein [Bryobacteraceae bacterium]|nr:glycosyltransferase family 2 protein [Bryobacteraceae bacterium]
MISIVMPAYNEAEIIETSVREWHQEVVSRIVGSELIVVNDCSTDATGEILARLAGELPGLRPVTPDRNAGHGQALLYGYRLATQPWVFQTDSDRQHVPAEFWSLWELRESRDFVFGARNARADGLTRACISTVMRLLNYALWRTWIRDANCPFKLMRREALERVLARVPKDTFIPMVMVSVLARTMGFRVAEVAVTHVPRRGGTQSLAGLGKWCRVGFRCAKELAAHRNAVRWSAD